MNRLVLGEPQSPADRLQHVVGHPGDMTRPQDVQNIFDAIPVEEKALHWITGTDRRFDGYNYFGVHPEVPIEWFDKHVK